MDYMYTRHICTLAWKKKLQIIHKQINRSMGAFVHTCIIENIKVQKQFQIVCTHENLIKKGEPLKMYFLKTFLFVGFQNHQWHEFITTVLHVLDRNDFKMKIAVFCLQITYSIFTLQQNLTASWQTVDYFH